MKNQVVFTDLLNESFSKSLEISDERAKEIVGKINFFVQNNINSYTSSTLEKILEGLNPNEAIYASMVLGKLLATADILKIFVDLFTDISPFTPAIVILPNIVQAISTLHQQMKESTEYYLTISKKSNK